MGVWRPASRNLSGSPLAAAEAAGRANQPKLKYGV
jgi:hypothetical protein